MNNSMLSDNQAKRLTIPLPLLLCYSLFTVWQMGVVFFTGTALSLDGKTPIPITAGNMTAVIVIAYILSIFYLIFFQRYSVITARIGIGISLFSSICLFFPLPNKTLAILITMQTFCCVFLIGIFISIVIGLFTEQSEIYDVLVTAVFAYTLIAILQNDTVKIPFLAFQIFTVIALIALLYFSFKMPTKSWPQIIKKGSELKCPMRFTIGIYLLIALSCILTLYGNTVGESITGGVSIINLSTAICGIIIFFIWKKFDISPLKCATALIGLSAVGFVLALAGNMASFLTYIACILLGCGCLACALTSFYGIVLFKHYPSRFVAPIISLFAVITVMLHSVLLEVFRNDLKILYILYSITAVVAAIIFLLVEPSLIWQVKKTIDTQVYSSITEETSLNETNNSNTLISSISELDEILSSFTVEPLSGQELRIAELILNGYTNSEMVGILEITVNTVKSYRKNLYEKLQIHSRRELFAIVNYKIRE